MQFCRFSDDFLIHRDRNHFNWNNKLPLFETITVYMRNFRARSNYCNFKVTTVLIFIKCYTLHHDWVVPEKIHPPPPPPFDRWDSGNSCGKWGSKTLEIQVGGGLNLKQSSAGVISTDSSRDSNI